MEKLKKKCFKCKEEKPLSEFYKQKKMKDGLLGKCKQCTKKDSTNNRNNNLEKIREYDRKRAKLPHRIQLTIKNTKKFRKKFPLAYKAHCAVNNAVRDGILIRPAKCPICKKTRQIEGHHEDYTKPLEVDWMCSACHKQFHRDLAKAA